MNHNNVQRYYTITLLLSALPVSTMSAPGTPDPAAAPGDMAAQQDHSPVTVHHHAVIPAPSTPVLPVHENAGLPIVNTDLTLRRASLGTPFYAEADAGLRDGPLEEPKGLLQDLSQIWEALEIGFEGIDPLQPGVVTLVLDHVLRCGPWHHGAQEHWAP